MQAGYLAGRGNVEVSAPCCLSGTTHFTSVPMVLPRVRAR